MRSAADYQLRRYWPLLVVLAELVVFVWTAGQIGLGWTLLLIVTTSIAGLVLLKIEGFRAWAAVREAAAQGRLDSARSQLAATGVRILIGVMLAIPGLLTTVAALALLLPPVRTLVGRRLSAAAFRTLPRHGAPRPGSGQVITGEVIEHRPATDYDRPE